MWHKSSCFSKSLHILGVTSIDIIYMQRLLSSWPCDYVNIYNWIIQSSGLLKPTQAKVPSPDAFLDFGQLMRNTPFTFLPFSPSSMLIDHIIITFLLMVVGCDGWEGCKSISRGLFVANIQPTNRPAACLSKIKWVVRSEVDYHHHDLIILSNIKWVVRSKFQTSPSLHHQS